MSVHEEYTEGFSGQYWKERALKAELALSGTKFVTATVSNLEPTAGPTMQFQAYTVEEWNKRERAAVAADRAALRKRVEAAKAQIAKELINWPAGTPGSHMRNGRLNTCQWFLALLNEQTEKI